MKTRMLHDSVILGEVHMMAWALIMVAHVNGVSTLLLRQVVLALTLVMLGLGELLYLRLRNYQTKSRGLTWSEFVLAHRGTPVLRTLRNVHAITLLLVAGQAGIVFQFLNLSPGSQLDMASWMMGTWFILHTVYYTVLYGMLTFGGAQLVYQES